MASIYQNFTPKDLYNQLDNAALAEIIAQEPYQRITVSFYRYAIIEKPAEFRHQLFLRWKKLAVLGRIYLAEEGINAQVSVPLPNYAAFQEAVWEEFPAIPFKEAVEEPCDSFLKLTIKVRKKILTDGQDDGSYDVTNVGNHLTAKEWNAAMELDDSVVVDVRNYYEHEVGHFADALKPAVDSFKEELPVIKEMLQGKEKQKVLLYCTGGIRCEKTSAWLKAQGFTDVNQLHGGIIDYTRQIKNQNLENKFIGKNFVFDGRLGERISPEVIAQCHQCGAPCDNHYNCGWDGCHILFIQCNDCRAVMQECCSPECQDAINLPTEEQMVLRREGPQNPPGFYNKSRCQREQKVRLRNCAGNAL